MASTPFRDTLINLRRSVGALQELLHEESGPISEGEVASALQVGVLCRTFINELFSNHPQATSELAMEDELWFNMTMDEIIYGANAAARKLQDEELAKSVADPA